MVPETLKQPGRTLIGCGVLAVALATVGIWTYSHGVNGGPAHSFNCFTSSWDHTYIADAASLQTDGALHRFSLKPDVRQINEGWREELSDCRGFRNGQTIEFDILTRLPHGYASVGPETSITLFQWHEALKNGHKRPPLSLKLRDAHELVFVVWNDKLFADHREGSGLEVARFEATPDRWIRLHLELNFDPEHGRLKISRGDCDSASSCGALALLYSGTPGIGYREALSYYFKFGAYTTQPFAQEFVVEHVISPEDIRVD